MFASSISVSRSRWRRGLLLVLLAAALVQSLLLPLQGLWLALFLLIWFAFAWIWWQSWQQAEPSHTLLLGDMGEVRWLPADRPSGVLLAKSLVLPWAIWLCWRTAPDKKAPAGRLQQYWLLADQCSDADFRALARAIRQCRWQQAPVN
ncbi:protein YgfX [Alkalimonas sp.]|uniref:protein YgfX n=1 Tax=Alkalimonas sp. TaxID=1872453 RepID=UPI00263B21E4|nr:protein YgfX [Alkalimonas sp.]MCC5826345.1 hypothetical protein [Alkalimonas sp.]